MSISLALQAQRQIELNKPQKFIQNDKYALSLVLDSTFSKDIGKVFVSGTEKGALKLHSGSIARHLKKIFLSQTSSKEVIISVKKLSFSEKMGENYLVNGNLNVQLDFYINFDGETSLLYQAKGGSNYQRSISFGYEDRLAELVVQSLYSCIQSFDNYVNQNHLKLEFFNQGSLIEVKPIRTGVAKDTLFYGDAPLSWKNFKAEPKGTSKFAAAIFPSFNIRSIYTIENGILKATIFPSVYMVESMSWVKQGGMSEYSLGHERLHFDIAYLAALSLIRSLRSIKASSQRDLQSYIQYEYLAAYRFMNRMQEKYDEDTKHGLNEAAQQDWENRIKEEIAAIQLP